MPDPIAPGCARPPEQSLLAREGAVAADATHLPVLPQCHPRAAGQQSVRPAPELPARPTPRRTVGPVRIAAPGHRRHVEPRLHPVAHSVQAWVRRRLHLHGPEVFHFCLGARPVFARQRELASAGRTTPFHAFGQPEREAAEFRNRVEGGAPIEPRETLGMDETRACRWLPVAALAFGAERQPPLPPGRPQQPDCLDPSGFLCPPRHQVHHECASSRDPALPHRMESGSERQAGAAISGWPRDVLPESGSARSI